MAIYDWSTVSMPAGMDIGGSWFGLLLPTATNTSVGATTPTQNQL